MDAGYDALATKWQTEPHLQKYSIAQFKRALQFVENHGHALDIGCGSSARFIDLLVEAGLEVEGIDVSEKMVELARRQRPGISFHHADICAWPLPRKYDFISAWDSIWHLPLAEQEPVMRKICGGLNRRGVFVFTTGGLDEPTEKSDSKMGVPTYYSILGITQTLELLHRFGCICRHLEYDQYPEKHLYIIAQKV